MMIREKGPLPFIIVAPLLNKDHTYFPDEYMDRILKKILADYRVDQKRIYLTGMSMGGEAAYRFALNQPDTFAAVSVLCGYINSPETISMEGIKDIPIWAIHGADDGVVPLVRGQQAVDALKKAGANVRFSVLAGHDHDVWTDTYSDPQFYKWFMQYQRPWFEKTIEHSDILYQYLAQKPNAPNNIINLLHEQTNDVKDKIVDISKRLGDLEVKNKNFEKAIDYYKNIIYYHPNDELVYVKIGHALVEIGD